MVDPSFDQDVGRLSGEGIQASTEVLAGSAIDIGSSQFFEDHRIGVSSDVDPQEISAAAIGVMRQVVRERQRDPTIGWQSDVG